MFVGEEMKNDNKIVFLFADTYINKQYACALTLLNQMVDFNIVPIFTFNRFWKTLLCTMAAWISYGVWGYEFTVVSLLALILCSKLSDSEHIF